MYTVVATFWRVRNRGTAAEDRILDSIAGPQHSGPFSTRESAESFARGLAAASELIARVAIKESDEGLA